MTEFRILVTGSRTWTDTDTVVKALTRALSGVHANVITLVHGGAEGLDKMAGHLAEYEFGLKVEVHPAQWKTHTARCPEWHWDLPKCKMAGHRRNAEMVNAGADICLAFIKDGSAGATGCANLAEAAGIRTVGYTE